MKQWAEAVNCVVFLVNLILKVDQNKPAVEAWNGNSAKIWFNSLVKILIILYVAKKDKSKVNMTEQGFPSITVGYASNPATRTYQMCSLTTKRVVLTCDVKWHGFDGANAANDPTLFDCTEGTGQKTLLGIMQ